MRPYRLIVKPTKDNDKLGRKGEMIVLAAMHSVDDISLKRTIYILHKFDPTVGPMDEALHITRKSLPEIAHTVSNKVNSRIIAKYEIHDSDDHKYYYINSIVSPAQEIKRYTLEDLLESAMIDFCTKNLYKIVTTV